MDLKFYKKLSASIIDIISSLDKAKLDLLFSGRELSGEERVLFFSIVDDFIAVSEFLDRRKEEVGGIWGAGKV